MPRKPRKLYRDQSTTRPRGTMHHKKEGPKSELEDIFISNWAKYCAHLEQPTAQYKFAKGLRRYRCDFYFPSKNLIVEIDGGEFTKGGGAHNRPGQYTKDCYRANLAVQLGYRGPLRFTTTMIRSDLWTCINQVIAILTEPV